MVGKTLAWSPGDFGYHVGRCNGDTIFKIRPFAAGHYDIHVKLPGLPELIDHPCNCIEQAEEYANRLWNRWVAEHTEAAPLRSSTRVASHFSVFP